PRRRERPRAGDRPSHRRSPRWLGGTFVVLRRHRRQSRVATGESIGLLQPTFRKPSQFPTYDLPGERSCMRVPPAKIHIPEEDRRQILESIDECLASGQLTLGKHGAAFEEDFAKTAGTKHAIATNSGHSSIENMFRTTLV